MRAASRNFVYDVAGKSYLLGPQTTKVVRALQRGARSYAAIQRKTGLHLAALYVIVGRLKQAKLAKTQTVKGEREVLVALRDHPFYNGRLTKPSMVY